MKTKLWGMLALMLCLNGTHGYGMDTNGEIEPLNGIKEMEITCPNSFLVRSAEIKRLPDPYYQAQVEITFGEDPENSYAIPSFKAGNKNYMFIPGILFQVDGCGNAQASCKLDSSNESIFHIDADKVKIKYSLMQKIKNLNLYGEKANIFAPLFRQAQYGDAFKMIIEFFPFMKLDPNLGEAVLETEVCIEFRKINDFPGGIYH